MVPVQYILFTLLAIPSFANPTPQDLEKRKLACTNSKIKAFSSSAYKIASKEVNSFCSSYLHYKRKTRTVTSTHTYDAWDDTTITSGTGTITLEHIVSATGTSTVKQTFGLFPYLKKRSLEKRNPAYAPPPAPTKHIKTDYQGKALGFPASIITTTSTDYSYTTERYTKTYANPTNCGTPAQPTFFIQLREADTSRTDGYNNWYLSTIQSDRFSSGGYGGGERLTVTKDKKRAALVYLEAKTGFLRTVHGGRYLNNDYFVQLTLLTFNTKEYVNLTGYQYNKCKIVQNGKEKELFFTVAITYPKDLSSETQEKYFKAFYTTRIPNKFNDGLEQLNDSCDTKQILQTIEEVQEKWQQCKLRLTQDLNQMSFLSNYVSRTERDMFKEFKLEATKAMGLMTLAFIDESIQD
ncbi:hypothetical protein ACHAPJ_009944 [Fusarium lateritium]